MSGAEGHRWRDVRPRHAQAASQGTTTEMAERFFERLEILLPAERV